MKVVYELYKKLFTMAYSDQIYDNFGGLLRFERETDLYISLVLGFEVGVS